jgi:hypothetical protein
MHLTIDAVQSFWGELEKIAEGAKKKVPRKTFLRRHPQASKYRADYYPYVGDLTELPYMFSPYRRYHDARHATSYISNDLLQERIGKIKKKNYGSPYAKAYFDEAKARGMKVPEGMGEAYRLASEAPVDPSAVVLAGIAGSLATALPTMGIFHQDAKGAKIEDTPLGKKLLQKAQEEGIKVFEHPNAHYRSDTHRIGIPKSVHPSVLAHELGHGTGKMGKKILQKLYGPGLLYARFGLPVAASATLVGKGLGDTAFVESDEEKVKQLQKAQNLALLAGVPYAPVLAEEARATGRGMVDLVRMGGKKTIPGALLRLAPAYGTYLAGLSGVGAAHHLLGKRRKKLEEKIEKKRLSKASLKKTAADSAAAQQRKRRRTVEALVGSAGGLALGYLGTRKALPAILKALGREKKPSKKDIAFLTALSGLTGAALVSSMGAYRDEPPPRATRKLRAPGAVQPENGQLAQRHKGHPDPVPTGPVLPDAPWSGVLPLRAGARPGFDGRREHGDNHQRRRKSEYGFRGKSPRDYRFSGPVRLRKHES